MRILHIATGLEKVPPDRLGSVEAHIFFVSKHLVKMGQETVILDRKYSPDELPFEEIEGIKIVRVPVKQFVAGKLERDKFPFLFWIRSPLNTILYTFKLNKKIKKLGDFDVINTYAIFATFLLIMLNRKARDKIYYNHQAAFWPSQSGGISNRAASLLGRFTMRRIKGVVVQNEVVNSYFISALKLPKGKVMLIPPGTDLGSLPLGNIEINIIKSKYELEEKKVILFVGRIHPEKGVEYLVRAANIVVNQFDHKDALFLLVGPFERFDINQPGEYTAKILGLIKSFDLEENARLTGYVPLEDLKGLYAASDIFVLPSIVEQFSVVVIEAMAFGKPAVVTKTPGGLMQIKDGWNGLLVEIADEKELAEKIKFLLENPEEVRRMGGNAKDFAKKFDWSKVAQRYLELFLS